MNHCLDNGRGEGTGRGEMIRGRLRIVRTSGTGVINAGRG